MTVNSVGNYLIIRDYEDILHYINIDKIECIVPYYRDKNRTNIRLSSGFIAQGAEISMDDYYDFIASGMRSTEWAGV